MRTRDLKKLEPGTKVKVTLTKRCLEDAPYLRIWTKRPVYFHKQQQSWIGNVPGWFDLRLNKKLTASIRIEPFSAKEISLLEK